MLGLEVGYNNMKGVQIKSRSDVNQAYDCLTAEETKWVFALQRVLARCPERLELVTIGDCSLRVVDKFGAAMSEIADSHADRDGIVLADIAGGPLVHGVSG